MPGISGGVDHKTGVLNVTVSYFVSTVEEVTTVGDFQFWGVPLKSRSFANWDSDSDAVGYQVDLEYEGRPGEGGDTEGQELESWSFSDSFREVPIEQHPYIGELVIMYGGWWDGDGKVQWPEKWDGALGDAPSFGLSASAKGEKTHPLLGRDTALIFHSIATREYWTRSLDAAYADMGKIYQNLPGQGPKISFAHGQNWLKRIVTPRSSGDGWLVSEEYWLSGPGGWKPGIDELVIR